MTLDGKRLILLAAVGLSACSVTGSGEIQCADDGSCPSDYPVCQSGKCVAGVLAVIAGVEGHSSTDVLHKSIRIDVRARAAGGVKDVSLAAGGKTFTASSSNPPLYFFDVDTAQLPDGTVSFTATVDANDGKVGTASSPLQIDNSAPVLTASATLPAAQPGALVTLDVTASKPLATLAADVLLSSAVIGHATEISAATGNVHHLGFAVVNGMATGTYTISVTATDAAGNVTASPLTRQFDVLPPPAVALSLTAPGAPSNPGQTVSLTANAASSATQAYLLPDNVAVTANGADQLIAVNPAVTTTYTLVATNGAGQEFRASATVAVTQPAITSFTGPAWVTAGKTAVALVASFTGSSASVAGCSPASAATSPATFTCGKIGAVTTTTYTLSVTLGTASATATTSVKSAPDPAGTSLLGPATALNPGDTATFVGQGCAGCTTSFSPPLTLDSGAFDSGFTAHATTAPTTSAVYSMSVTNQAGDTALNTQPVVVTQPTITSFAGPAFVTAGKTATLTAQFTPASATTSVPGCAGGTVSGASPSSRTFTCGTVSADTIFTLSVALGTTTVTSGSTVRVAPDPAVNLSFTATPPAMPFGTTTQPTLNAQFCGGSARCTATCSANGGTPFGMTSGVNLPVTPPPPGTTTYSLLVTNQANSTATAQITVPVYGSPFSTSVMGSARQGAAVALLSSGKVLVAGGSTANTAATALDTAEIFDPSTATWTAVSCPCASCAGSGAQAKLHAARFQATATTLSNGGVLIAGGANNANPALTSADVYDPTFDCFRANSFPLNTARAGHTATAYNGAQNVVIIGGSSTKTCEVYALGGSIEAGAFTACSHNTSTTTTPDMQVARTNHVAILLAGGRYVLAAGGAGGNKSADVYDTASNGVDGFTNLANNTMQVARTSATATMLPSGKVLVAGGGTQTAELFTFNSSTVSGSTVAAGGSGMANSRTGHAAIALNGGGVLLAGGSSSTTVEIYDPVGDQFGNSFALGTARAGPTFGLPLLLGGRALVGGGTSSATAADYIVP